MRYTKTAFEILFPRINCRKYRHELPDFRGISTRMQALLGLHYMVTNSEH